MMHYFGAWADPDAALQKYLEQKDDLLAGRKPRPDTEGLTVKEAANAFLNAKQALVDAGELSPRTWSEYSAMAVELVGAVERIIFFNPEDGATIAALRTGETVRGQVEDAELERGVTYRFLGRWVEHFKYGRQFQFGTCLIHSAGDRTGIIRYLKQVAPHVGHITAAKLYQLWVSGVPGVGTGRPWCRPGPHRNPRRRVRRPGGRRVAKKARPAG
jgi:hypothetical protein